MTTDTDTLVARLRNPPFGTETSERNLMASAADRIEALEAEVARWKSRGDNHWETMRCIYRIATEEGDMQAVIQHIKDAGSGYTERPEETLRRYQTELATTLAQLTEARAGEDELLAAMREIYEVSERKESKYPPDWRDQIAACPECQRYKGHPIQDGICDQHRKPIYAQEDHDRRETNILGYRAKDIARAALASYDKRKEGR